MRPYFVNIWNHYSNNHGRKVKNKETERSARLEINTIDFILFINEILTPMGQGVNKTVFRNYI